MKLAYRGEKNKTNKPKEKKQKNISRSDNLTQNTDQNADTLQVQRLQNKKWSGEENLISVLHAWTSTE